MCVASFMANPQIAVKIFHKPHVTLMGAGEEKSGDLQSQ